MDYTYKQGDYTYKLGAYTDSFGEEHMQLYVRDGAKLATASLFAVLETLLKTDYKCGLLLIQCCYSKFLSRYTVVYKSCMPSILKESTSP